MKKMLQKLSEKKVVVDIIFLLFVTIILSIQLFKTNTDIYLDDGSQHLMRAYGTYQSLKENGTANIISDYANGFGYSWNLFYGPLSSDFLILLGVLVRNFNLAFKLLMTLIIFFAAIFMYKFVSEMTNNKSTVLLASVIYITSPYFFTDIYIRHAIGECFAFVFIPLVFLGLYNLFNTEKNHYHLIFGAVGLIISHNISTILVAILAIIYCIVNIKNLFSSKVKKGLIIDIIFILLISCFYWIPLLETKYSTNYRVFESDAMSTQESFLNHAINVKDFFVTQNNTILVFEIGLPVIIMLVFSIMAFRNLKNNKKEYLFFLISGLITYFMATKYFPWKYLPNSVYIIQFPWRMLVLSTFCFAIVCSLNMSIIIKNFNIKDVIIISIICIIYIFSKHGLIQYSENVEKTEDYEVSDVSGQNNEWLPGMGRLEYLPSKAYDNTFYIATRKEGVLSLDNDCQISDETKAGLYLVSKVEIASEDVTLELPYIYYPGYTIRLDGIILDPIETENGFLGCVIPANEKGNLEVKYTGTKLMHISKIISILATIIFAIYVWKKH